MTSDEGHGPNPEGQAAAPGGPSLPMLLAIVNTVVAVGVVGLLYYTKVIFKRPEITEQAERARLAALAASPRPAVLPGQVVFPAVTVNIQPGPGAPAHPAPTTGGAAASPRPSGEGAGVGGKLHYATVGFTVEIRDDSRKPEIEALRPVIMDKLLSTLGRKTFQELSTVQGRYLLRTQLLDMVNELVVAGSAAATPKPGKAQESLATNVFFTQFLIQ